MGVATRPEADLGTPAGPRPTAQPPRPSPGPKALRRIPRRPRLPGAPRLRRTLLALLVATSVVAPVSAAA
ncbi:hypothetical protein PV435_26415, partial [Streptomyces scabiei]|nr:hypothetical protein [Streptomyces scabiei]